MYSEKTNKISHAVENPRAAVLDRLRGENEEYIELLAEHNTIYVKIAFWIVYVSLLPLITVALPILLHDAVVQTSNKDFYILNIIAVIGGGFWFLLLGLMPTICEAICDWYIDAFKNKARIKQLKSTVQHSNARWFWNFIKKWWKILRLLLIMKNQSRRY
jgi:ABC-type bacteriocin/lantibiotic exporter with double-glycine peptidase domain